MLYNTGTGCGDLVLRGALAGCFTRKFDGFGERVRTQLILEKVVLHARDEGQVVPYAADRAFTHDATIHLISTRLVPEEHPPNQHGKDLAVPALAFCFGHDVHQGVIGEIAGRAGGVRFGEVARLSVYDGIGLS